MQRGSSPLYFQATQFSQLVRISLFFFLKRKPSVKIVVRFFFLGGFTVWWLCACVVSTHVLEGPPVLFVEACGVTNPSVHMLCLILELSWSVALPHLSFSLKNMNNVGTHLQHVTVSFAECCADCRCTPLFGVQFGPSTISAMAMCVCVSMLSLGSVEILQPT